MPPKVHIGSQRSDFKAYKVTFSLRSLAIQSFLQKQSLQKQGAGGQLTPTFDENRADLINYWQIMVKFWVFTPPLFRSFRKPWKMFVKYLTSSIIGTWPFISDSVSYLVAGDDLPNCIVKLMHIKTRIWSFLNIWNINRISINFASLEVRKMLS